MLSAESKALTAIEQEQDVSFLQTAGARQELGGLEEPHKRAGKCEGLQRSARQL